MDHREENRKRVEEDASMNMTPMIDVVFLLIIFFLCIDFRILEAKLPAHLPKDIGSLRLDPIEKLRIKIVCDSFGKKTPRPFQPNSRAADSFRPATYRLEGHRVHYMLGPERIDTTAELGKRLQQLRPNMLVPGWDGQMRPADVVIEPHPGAVYGDVAPVVDVVLAADFPKVTFGGGLGRVGQHHTGK